jgi:ATP-binding cassette subfamily C (CFTR/MRP) protein 1
VLIKDVRMRYRDGPEVLKGVTVSIAAGQKVGVVGRTGSGKSSLMIALFRIVELSGGSIEIDGVDISTIGTAPLRGGLSIIPQDPVLFNNTVRYNVDPFKSASDDEIREVLDKCRMGTVVDELEKKLDEVVRERRPHSCFRPPPNSPPLARSLRAARTSARGSGSCCASRAAS